jgi:hypothetical protein
MNQKWWLISDESYREIQKNLVTTIEQTKDAEPLKLLRDALHTLDTGLSRTNEIPSDWRGRKPHVPIAAKTEDNKVLASLYDGFLYDSLSVSSCPNPESAIKLYEAMSRISEKYFEAGWITDNEVILWNLINGTDQGVLLAMIAEQDLQQLKELSNQCDGWWKWDMTMPEFVRLNQWCEVVSS